MSFVCSNKVQADFFISLKSSWSDFFNVKNSRSEIMLTSSGWPLKLGYRNPIDILGLTMHDINCPATDLSDEYIHQDKAALSGEIQKTYITLTMPTNREILPILYTRECFGEYVVSNHKVMNSGLFADRFYQRITAIDRRYYRKMQSCYEVVSCYDGLTKRETEVLYHVMLGMRSTMIGNMLSISARTVQHTIDRIKYKYQCDSLQQLVELSLYLGLNKKIPRRFL